MAARLSDETLAMYETVPQKTVAGVLVHQRAFDDLLTEARRARESEAALLGALRRLFPVFGFTSVEARDAAMEQARALAWAEDR